MSRRQIRKPFWRRWRYLRHRYCLLALTLAFISALVTFLITFYATSDYFLEFVSYMFSSQYKTQLEPFFPHIAENYQGREFSGKSQSVIFDTYITYNDFNYLKPETLTYKKRTYSNNIEILYRLPKKLSPVAVLLVFHACKRSAYDWFHTIERQRIIGAAIDLGFVCLVFQATDNDTQCWSTDADIYENKDVQMIFKGLESFYQEYSSLSIIDNKIKINF